MELSPSIAITFRMHAIATVARVLMHMPWTEQVQCNQCTGVCDLVAHDTSPTGSESGLTGAGS